MGWEERCSISMGESVSVGVRVHASGIGIRIATRAVVSEPLTPKPKTELETKNIYIYLHRVRLGSTPEKSKVLMLSDRQY
jgi:hypothetical protein